MKENVQPGAQVSRHRRAWFAALAVLAVVVVASTGAALLPQRAVFSVFRQETLGEMTIDAGRLDAIMRNAESGLEDSRRTMGSSPGEQRSEIANLLVESVVRFNANVARACREQAVPTPYCNGPWTPRWLYRPASEIHNDMQLRLMLNETESHVEPFWRALCARRTDPRRAYPMCVME